MFRNLLVPAAAAACLIFAATHILQSRHEPPRAEPLRPPPATTYARTVAGGRYRNFVAQGKIPDCIADTWRDIWAGETERAYITDFEVYDERSKDWKDGRVEIFIGIK